MSTSRPHGDGGGAAAPVSIRSTLFKRWVLVLVAVALVIRVAAAVASFHAPIGFDAHDYDRHARSIASGHGYPRALRPSSSPTAFRPPAFPYFLALVYKVHVGWNSGRIAQAIIGTALVTLIGAIAYQLLGAASALAALAIAAIYPPFVVLGTTLLSEPLFIVCELAALLAALRSRGSPHRLRWAAGAGALGGMAWLTRDTGAVVIAAVALVAWTGGPRFSRRALAAPSIVVLCALAVISPWTVRNALVMHAFLPVSDEAGYTLAGTYNATSAASRTDPASWIPAQQDPAYAPLIYGAKSEVDIADKMRRAAVNYASRHPLYVPEVGLYNGLRMLYLDGALGVDSTTVGVIDFQSEEDVSVGVAYLAIAGFAVVLFLAIAAVAGKAARRMPRIVWSMPVLLACLGAFTSAGNRYRAPIDPFLIILAAAAVAPVIEARQAQATTGQMKPGSPPGT